MTLTGHVTPQPHNTTTDEGDETSPKILVKKYFASPEGKFNILIIIDIMLQNHAVNGPISEKMIFNSPNVFMYHQTKTH
jgi:hypothetical protein